MSAGAYPSFHRTKANEMPVMTYIRYATEVCVQLILKCELWSVVMTGQDSEEVSVCLCHDPFCIISTPHNDCDNGLLPSMELHNICAQC